MIIAEVCANVPIRSDQQTYSYIVPEELNYIGAGWRVMVPFGNRLVDGFILDVYDCDPEQFDFELKAIDSAIDDEAWFTPPMIDAARRLADFYLCPLSQTMTLFMPGRVSRKRRASKKKIDGCASSAPSEKFFELTIDQRAAIEAVSQSIEAREHRGFLLHGVTGSGKTQVYIELTARVRRLGRRAVILVPEIALTGQIVFEFKRRFDDVIVIHSRLSIGERSEAFYKIRRGEVGVVIGARSALFTPIDDVGLFVIDEEQDHSYKQSNAPHYHARIVAEEFARAHGAPIVFGSATPSLETYYRARKGELTLLRLPMRIDDRPLPTVECVDMRKELKANNRSVLSRALKELLTAMLENGDQAIILLNRRGYSTFVMCRSCGLVIKCFSCGLPMVYHTDGKLRCHRCEVERATPKVCPKCGSKYIKYFGAGTQKLEQVLTEELPSARILRMDRDTTTKKFSHQRILDQFRAREADILLGTQMVAKGHDIAGVTAVGILSADASLNLPDFRSSEVCFMLITQAAGRAGRSDRSGRVIVQAYNPEHPAVVNGCRQDYEKFYEDEIEKRRELFYPPFSRLIRLLIVGKDESKTKARAEEIAQKLRAELEARSECRSEVPGSVAAMVAKWRGIYRFVVLIKTEDLDRARECLRGLELDRRDDVTIDIDPIEIF